LNNSALTHFFQVGTSSKKRKQSSSVKRDKKKAKQENKASNATAALCNSCKKVGHKSVRSTACENHLSSKAEDILQNLGEGYEAYTRKSTLETSVNDSNRHLLKTKILSVCENIRQIAFRAQIFVNHFVFSRGSAPSCIFKQNFWYTICQLVNERSATSNRLIPEDLQRAWRAFKESHPSIVYNNTLMPGASQCLSEYCKQLATAYQNNIVENFEARVKRHLFYVVQNLFVVSFK
jgi:hypothetical protein